jgi:hypothetical protein
MPSLSDKLRMIDTGAKKPANAASPPPPPEACYHTLHRFPLTPFSDFRHTRADVLAEIYGIPFPKTLRPQDVLFLDTETTGLSGGAGTVAFEVGLGYVSGGDFVVEQFLMRDYPEEPLLLDRVASILRAFPALVTFNGRTFDIPLLESRFLMHRMAEAHAPGLHADVLHAARGVWKLRLGRCTLQKLESAVLGVTREDDLPGADVPQTYFRYLKDRDFAPIERILEHNRQDVVSLAQLFFYLCMLYDRPETVAEPDDLFALARAMEKRGASVKARKCYRMAAQGAMRANAYAAMATAEKRAGHTEIAVRLYAAMLARGDEPVLACEGLAKLYEHRLKNPEQALVYTRQALLLLSEPGLNQGEAVQLKRNALQYRYARLRRRLLGAENA